jgi:hypothetical protein
MEDYWEHSVTYQAIVQRGKVQVAREWLLYLGQERFGAPEEAVRAMLNAIADPEPLEEMKKRLLHVDSWQELLQPLTPRRSGRRRPSGK